ncbi:3-deoxy-8-phosphooctulonate synthase [Candidatus Microgenomates bacterium]|nr:3-deoxy-8-phosphooctulonate synthase [Candidatus Microgenomates bacterium]
MTQLVVGVKNLKISNNLPFILIAGPDSIESEKHALFMAREIKRITTEVSIPYIFKASYDKANRTSVKSFRGVGLKKGIGILQKIQSELDLPVTTDVHSPDEATQAGKVVDLIQIPALLSRQTDLLVAAGATGKPVNVKKGQFIAPQNVDKIIQKVQSTGNSQVMITERGTTFGYNDIVTDMRGLEIMKRFGFPIILDAAHTVQFPSVLKESSGGDRTLIPTLARAAVGVGVAGIFIEVHNDPDNAPVDGLSSLDLKDLRKLLITLKKIDRSVK